MDLEYKRLVVRGISYSQTQTGAYALILECPETTIKLPIVIGGVEAQAISIGLEKDLKAPRPLTHDLFKNFIAAAGFEVTSVTIYKLIDGVFFSNINIRDVETGRDILLDARTSDAVAMAVRFEAPIFAMNEVLDEAGIFLEIIDSRTNEPLEPIEEPPMEEDFQEDYRQINTEALKQLLDEALKIEDYDEALKIQEELNRRKKKID
jgi:bifunctional DNase/RNase